MKKSTKADKKLLEEIYHELYLRKFKPLRTLEYSDKGGNRKMT